MPDGSVFMIKAEEIALNRALYYSDKHVGPRGEKEKILAEEMKMALEDDAEMIDWAKNNMNWDDVKQYANQLKAPDAVDYQDGWVNGEMEVVPV